MTTVTLTIPAIATPAAGSPAPSSWRRGPAAKALALTLVMRLFYSLVAALLSPTLALDPRQVARFPLTEHLMQRAQHPILYALFGVWERFDTLWYIHIANRGYETQSAVFYPLYPALIRVFSFFTRWDLLSCLLIVNLSTFFFFWGALRLFELHAGPRNAFRAVLLWTLFPDSFVFFSAYPDSLLLALTVWSLYFASSCPAKPRSTSTTNWLLAGLLGLLAGCAKAFGCLTFAPILYLGWRTRDWRAIPAAALTGLGAASFRLWLTLHHYPSTTHIYQTYWQTTTSMPWTTIAIALKQLAHDPDSLLILNFGVLVLVFAAGFISRVPLEFRIYTLAAFCLIAAKNTDPVFQSSVRYSLLLFAVFPALARKLENNFNFLTVALPALMLNLFLLRVYLDWGLVV